MPWRVILDTHPPESRPIRLRAKVPGVYLARVPLDIGLKRSRWLTQKACAPCACTVKPMRDVNSSWVQPSLQQFPKSVSFVGGMPEQHSLLKEGMSVHHKIAGNLK